MDELPSIEMVPSTQPTLIASPPPALSVLAIVLPIVAIAFAAFCVWLVVRIYNRRERWAKWTLAATLALPVLYVASFGPACWWFAAPDEQGMTVKDVLIYKAPILYSPIGWIDLHSPRVVQRALSRYAFLAGSPEILSLPTNLDGSSAYFIHKN